MTKEEILTNFVNEVAPEITLTFNNEDDSYYEYTHDIICVDVNPMEDDGFLRHLAEVHECEFTYEYPLLFWTILHELGHYYTLEDIDDLEDEINTRILCATVPIEVAYANPNIQNMYYNLPSEWYATEWAIEFISNNREACTELAEQLA